MANDLDLFYPPRQNPLLVRLLQSVSYPLIWLLYKFEVVVSDEAVAQLRQLEPHRLVYLCNHPTLEDGVAMFGLSARVGHLFHYIVARESFEGLLGKFLQGIGCYSIRRGLGDRASIGQTLSLLKTPGCRLVIFPEGGCSYQNDTIMPFRSGAIQMPLQVMGQLAKQAEVPDLYLVPVSLKYRYTQPMEPIIEKTLAGLERTLGVTPQPGQGFYERLIAIAAPILTRLETEYGLPTDAAGSWNDRIDRLRRQVIAQCERQLGLEPNLNTPVRERVYKVQSVLEAQETEISEDESRYEALYWTTVRLLNFDAIYDGYVAENPTPERFLDTLMRLEREVYKIEHIKPKAHRQAIFNIGTPVNLKDYVEDYRKDKSATVERLTQQLQATTQANLK